MSRKHTPRLLVAAAAVLLAGCEHATRSQPLVRTRPELVLGQAVNALKPEERAALIDVIERAQQQPGGGERLFSRTRHPLDGLTAKQIDELFAAAGVSPAPYLPAGFKPCSTDCAGPAGAR